MAIQILPERASVGELLGTGLGAGLSQSLQALAQQRMGELQQRRQVGRTAQALSGLGIPQETVAAVAGLPPQLQAEYIKNMRRQAQEATLQQMLGGVAPELAPGVQPAAKEAEIGALFGGAQLPAQQLLEISKLKHEKTKEERKATRELWQYNQKYLEEMDKKLDTTRKNITRFDTLDKLVRTGNLTNPLYYSVLKKIGLDIPVLLNPGKKGSAINETYNKTVQDFVSDIKDVFGARITEKQIEVFLKALPTLENTDEGKRLIIGIMKAKHQATLAKGQIADDVIAENEGAPPYNLRSQVNKRMMPVYNKLGEDISDAIDAVTAYTEGPSTLVGKTVDADVAVPEGTTATSEDGRRFVMRNGQWVLLSGEGA